MKPADVTYSIQKLNLHPSRYLSAYSITLEDTLIGYAAQVSQRKWVFLGPEWEITRASAPSQYSLTREVIDIVRVVSGVFPLVGEK